MNLLTIAESFGKFVHEQSGRFDIDDIFIYGSLARKHKTPADIDIMLLHHNPIFAKVQEMRGKDGLPDDIERVRYLSEELLKAGYPTLEGLMAIPECTRALEGGILNIVYLHVDYFGDKSYREEFDATNINPKFIEAVIDTGLIWDPKTNKFDIPISQKYSLPTE